MSQQRTDWEGAEQRSLFDWASMQRLPIATTAGEVVEVTRLSEVLLWIPNGVGKLKPQVAAKMKAQGIRPGVPDLFLPIPVGQFHGLWIELKAAPPQRSTISELQLEWLRRLQRCGYAATVCRGWVEAKDALVAYLGGRFGAAEVRQ